MVGDYIGDQMFAKQVDCAPQHIATLSKQRDTRMPVPDHALPDEHTYEACRVHHHHPPPFTVAKRTTSLLKH